jgi:hypothetical protein
MNALGAFCSGVRRGSGSDDGQLRETHGAPLLPAMTNRCNLASLDHYFMCQGLLPGKFHQLATAKAVETCTFSFVVSAAAALWPRSVTQRRQDATRQSMT